MRKQQQFVEASFHEVKNENIKCPTINGCDYAEVEKKTGRMRRAYLKPYMAKPKNTGLNKEGMASLYNNVQTQGHNLAFSQAARLFALEGQRAFDTIRGLMETRTRMLEQNKNLQAKEEFLHVVLQQSKHFKLVLFWASGVPKYHFIKHEDFKGLVSVSQPYVSRDSAMDAFEHRDIFWLDFIRIG